VNGYKAIRALTARVDLQFQTEKEIHRGVGRRWRTAEGRILVARPDKIHLLIQAPLVKTNIAEMACDGTHFQVILYPKEVRTFIQGTVESLAVEVAEQHQPTGRHLEAGAFSRVRPHHFTEALLVPPIDPDDPDVLLTKEEVRLTEPSSGHRGSRRARVIRTYWVISVIRKGSGHEAILQRKYWFDATQNLPLVREQFFSPTGDLLADIWFKDFVRLAQFDGLVPTRITLRRPHDRYSVSMSLHASSLNINIEPPDRAFRLEKPPSWGDEVETIDLDKRGRVK
ncbi:MAG: hypothetical protein D6723_00775, partial [Acidobacteria bacterium]